MEETEDINIKKAKLSRDGSVEASYIDADGNDIAFKGFNKCHPDLRAAFQVLVPFFADLTEQKEADSIDWNNIESEDNKELLKKIQVNGISIGGSEHSRLITMSGNRTLATSRILNLNTPGVPMEDDTFEWQFISEFDLAVQALLYEVKAYILNKKWEVRQETIDFDTDNDDPFAAPQPADDAAPLDTVA